MSADTKTKEYNNSVEYNDLNAEYKIKLLAEENRILKKNLYDIQSEIEKYREMPYLIARIVEIVEEKAIIF
ncbi:MAG: hypothetical protein KAQ92_00230 [Candidatus Aenigmarchaeota archaeon]|nr:hypothetical protein [Candidatus Aenigmarchaeota archaeon]